MVGFGDIWKGLGNAVGRISGAGAGAYGGAINWLGVPGMRPVDAPYGNPLTGAFHGGVKAPWDKPYSARQLYEDVGLYKPGQEREWWMSPLEFGTDVATDPTSWAGGIGKAASATGKLGSIGKIAESAGKFGTLGEDATRIEHLAQAGRRFAHGTTLGAGDPTFGLLYAGVPKAFEVGKKVLGGPAAKSAAIEKLMASKGAQAATKASTKILGQKIPETLREGDYDVVSGVLRNNAPVGSILTPNAAPVVATKAVVKTAPKEIPETLSERDLGLLDELWPEAPKTPKTPKAKPKTKLTPEQSARRDKFVEKTKAAAPKEESVLSGKTLKDLPPDQQRELERLRKGGAIGEAAPTSPKPASKAAIQKALDKRGGASAADIEAADKALIARRTKAKTPKGMGEPATPEQMEALRRDLQTKKTAENVPPFLRSNKSPPTIEDIEKLPEIQRLRGAARTSAISKRLRSFGQSG